MSHVEAERTKRAPPAAPTPPAAAQPSDLLGLTGATALVVGVGIFNLPTSTPSSWTTCG